MSFIPSGSSKQPGSARDEDTLDDFEDGGAAVREARKKDKKVERFGHGMQKGLEEDDGEVEGESRSGRTKRRHPGRSASKNVFRKR